ncbi:O-antigen ligase family protein [Robiginitalea sp. IMCC44478]|uniref:O-antigen ligase family protein n=1 Tax=Robiginitalea sp. IMCC44478 TaxID=3459122 RepID=UPI0040427ADD
MLVESLGASQFYLAFIITIPLLAAVQGLLKKKDQIINVLIVLMSFGFLVLLRNLTSLLFICIVWAVLIVRLIIANDYNKAFLAIMFGGIILSLSSQVPMIQDRMQFIQKTTDFDIETIITKNRYTYTKNTLEHRMLIDYLAINIVQESLPFGLGTGDVQDRLNKEYATVGFKSGIKLKYNTHNQYLEEFLKTGLLGGVAFLILLGCLCGRINWSDYYYPYILLFFIAGCFFESYLNRQHGVFILGFIIPYFLNSETPQK